MTTLDLRTKRYDTDDPRLQRHVVHDPRSLSFRLEQDIDPASWRTRTLRIYDPKPNPNQTIGNCTAVSKAVQFNTAGNRRPGVVLGMPWAVKLYELETTIDPFPGTYPPDDTGSNGLAACKAAQRKSEGAAYRWISKADGVVQAVNDGWAVSVGTRWDRRMFTPDSDGRVHPGGATAGGHQWTVTGYRKDADWVRGVCWWGDFRAFYISRFDLAALLADDGDAHVQTRQKVA